MRKLNRQSWGSRVRRVSRLLLGSALLLSILSANIPSAVVAKGPLCNLACCAGRAPHAAGSCMNGSCHAVLGGRQKATHIHRESSATQVEQLCGLPQRSGRASLWSLPSATTRYSTPEMGSERSTEGQASRKAPVRLSLSASSLGRPCQSDCGAVTISSTNQRRPRESATHSFADRVHPPSNPGSVVTANNFIYTRDAIRWQADPRAPPARRS